MNVCPGLMEAGCAVKLMMRASMSRAFVYADPSKPADAAPGARGDGAVCAGCAGACANARAEVTTRIDASVRMAFICDPFYDFIIRPSPSFMNELIMEGAPLLAAPPVQEIMSPTFTVLRVQPYPRRWFRLIISTSHSTMLPFSSLTSR